MDLNKVTLWASFFTFGLLTYVVIMGYSFLTFKLVGKVDPLLRIVLLIPLLLVLGWVVYYAVQYAFVVKLFR